MEFLHTKLASYITLKTTHLIAVFLLAFTLIPSASLLASADPYQSTTCRYFNIVLKPLGFCRVPADGGVIDPVTTVSKRSQQPEVSTTTERLVYATTTIERTPVTQVIRETISDEALTRALARFTPDPFDPGYLEREIERLKSKAGRQTARTQDTLTDSISDTNTNVNNIINGTTILEQLTTVGTTTVRDNLVVEDNATIGGTLDVTATTTFSSFAVENASTTNATTTNSYITNLSVDDATSTTNTVTGSQYFSFLNSGSIPFIGTDGLLTEDNANLFWDATNDRLGIGTTSPAAKLDVTGTGRFTDALTLDSTLGVTGTSTLATTTITNLSVSGNTTQSGTLTLGDNLIASGNWLSGDGDDEGIYVDSDGNVGVGTSNPGEKFEISGGSINVLSTGEGIKFLPASGLNLIRNYTSEYEAGLALDTRYPMIFQTPTTGAIEFINRNNDSLFAIGGDQTIYAAGDVGIGTTTPQAKLHIIESGMGDSPLTVVGNSGNPADSTWELDTPNMVLEQSNGSAGAENMLLFKNSNNGGTNMAGITAKYFGAGETTNATLGFSTGVAGTLSTQMVIDSSGNIGIGTTSPSSLLQVEGTAWLRGGATTDGLYVNSSGNVGIGTTGPGSKLSVSGGASIGNSYAGTAAPSNGAIIQGNVGIGTTGPNDKLHVAGGNIRLSNDYALKGSDSGGTARDLIQMRSGDYTAIGDTTSAQSMVINQGNVGIGTTAPDSALHILGANDSNMQLTLQAEGSVSTYAGITFRDSVQQQAIILVRQGSDIGSFKQNGLSILSAQNDLTLTAQNNNNISLWTNPGTSALDSVERLTVTNTGNVGIGTTSPGQKLHIENTGGDALITSNFGSTGQGGIRFEEGGTRVALVQMRGSSIGSSQDQLQIGTDLVGGEVALFSGDTSEAMRIDKDGNVGIGTTSPSSLLQVEGTAWLRGGATTDGLYVNSSGNVGIGTTIPNAKLQIEADFGPTDIFTMTGDPLASGDYWSYRFVDNVDDTIALSFWDDSGSAYDANLAVTNLGNVGIGTTEPVDKLHVTKDDYSLANIFVSNDSSGIAGIGFNGQSSTQAPSAAIFHEADGGWGQGDLQFAVDSGQNWDEVTTDDIKLTIKGSGNVGIGTTDPNQKLVIAGNEGNNYLNLLNSDSSSGAIVNGTVLGQVGFSGSDTTPGITAAAVRGLGAGSWTSTDTTHDAHLTFLTQTNSTIGLEERMRITNAGNVGIGTTSPSELLHLSDSSTPKLLIENEGGSSVSLWAGTGAGVVGTESNNPMLFYTDGSEAMRLGTDRRLSIGTQTGNAALTVQTSGSTDILNLFETSGSEVFTVLESGNVGIGTTSPQEIFHISGTSNPTLRIDPGSSTTADPHLKLLDSIDGLGLDLWYDNSTGDTYFDSLGNADGYDVHFRTKTNDTPLNALTIKGSGNVGIGTTSPDSLLHIEGTQSTPLQVTRTNGSVHAAFTSLSGAARLDLDGTTDSAVRFITSGGTPQWVLGRDNTDSSFRIAYDTSSVGTNDRLVIDNAGNVGIGTTGPGAKLETLESTNDTPVAVFRNNGGGSGSVRGKGYVGFGIGSGWDVGGYIGWDQESVSGYQQALTFGTRGNSDVFPTERMRIDSSGNVGIGTTSPSSLLELYKVSGDSELTVGSTNGEGNIILNGSGGGQADNIYFKVAGTERFRIRTDSSNDKLYITEDGGSGITLTNSGNVGIGTTGPDSDAKLHVFDSGGASSAAVKIEDVDSNSNPSLYMENDSREWRLQVRGNLSDDFVIKDQTAGTERLTIDTSGNVGIGTTAPTSFKLQVAGNVGPNADNTYTLGAVGSDWECVYYEGGSLGTCASDENLKTNINDLTFAKDDTSALEKLSELRIRSFEFNEALGDTYNGLIAQEVREAGLESLVIERDNGYLAVKYGDLQWVVIEAIQNLWNKVQEYFIRTEKLEQEVETLKKRLEALESGNAVDLSGDTEQTNNPVDNDGTDLVDQDPVSINDSDESTANGASGAGDTEAENEVNAGDSGTNPVSTNDSDESTTNGTGGAGDEPQANETEATSAAEQDNSSTGANEDTDANSEPQSDLDANETEESNQEDSVATEEETGEEPAETDEELAVDESEEATPTEEVEAETLPESNPEE